MAGTSADSVRVFSELFRGNENGYGQTVVGEMVNGKAEAQCHLVYELTTPSVYNKHLDGITSIGIAPIRDDGTCFFGAIDIDDYDYDLLDIVDAIEDFEIPLCPCWSKSKKLHVYIFFSDATPAAEVIKILSWYRDVFFLPKKTEIFPKQAKASNNNKFYSWINLPYFDANSDNHRKMVGKNGHLLGLSDAMEKMWSRRLTIAEHWDIIHDLEVYGAPPCVASGMLLRDVGPGQRNNWLFSVGVFARIKDPSCDVEDFVTRVNDSLHHPIEERELRTTILTGLTKRNYFYKCNDMHRCDKEACKHCEYGIKSNKTVGVETGKLRRIMTNPPTYEWEIGGKWIPFPNEESILTQTRFRTMVMRYCNVVPNTMKNGDWSEFVSKALEGIEELDANNADMMSRSNILRDLLSGFINARRPSVRKEDVYVGRVYYDEEAHQYLFRNPPFLNYVTQHNPDRSFGFTDIEMTMREWGCRILEGRVWAIPDELIDKIPEPKKEETQVNGF